MKAKPVKTIVDGALEKLNTALRQGRSENLKAFLTAMSRFHKYSFGNILLIAVARPDASRVAGYGTWRRLGRQVRRGEKGIAILAPIVWKKSGNLEDQSSEISDGRKIMERSSAVSGFRTVHVFDVTQTDGKPLPDFARVRGDPREYTERLKDFVAARGIAVEYSAHLGGAEGMSLGNRIRIRAGLSAAEEFSTLVHEVAHEFLHRADDKASRTVRETEAEAIAFVVCEAVGLQSGSASSDYIQLYDGKQKTLAASLERIRMTSTKILDGLEIGQEQRQAA